MTDPLQMPCKCCDGKGQVFRKGEWQRCGPCGGTRFRIPAEPIGRMIDAPADDPSAPRSHLTAHQGGRAPL